MQIPIPAGARPAGGSDGHMTVVTPEGWEYDFWQAKAPPAGGGTLTFAWGKRTRIDGIGHRRRRTASGFGILAGMIRAPELAAGTDQPRAVHRPEVRRRARASATATTATSGGASAASSTRRNTAASRAAGGSETNMPPMGTRFTLAMCRSTDPGARRAGAGKRRSCGARELRRLRRRHRRPRLRRSCSNRALPTPRSACPTRSSTSPSEPACRHGTATTRFNMASGVEWASTCESSLRRQQAELGRRREPSRSPETVREARYFARVRLAYVVSRFPARLGDLHPQRAERARRRRWLSDLAVRAVSPAASVRASERAALARAPATTDCHGCAARARLVDAAPTVAADRLRR